MNTVCARRQGHIEAVIHQNEGTPRPRNLKDLVDKSREIERTQVSFSDLYQPAAGLDGVLDCLQLESDLTRLTSSSRSLKQSVRDQVEQRAL